jgi:N-acetylmuramoyl-L-alanine amidase
MGCRNLTTALWLLPVLLGLGLAQLSPPRVGVHPGYTRVVWELPNGASYRLEPIGPALRVVLPNAQVRPARKTVAAPELRGYVLEQKSTTALLTLLTPQGVGLKSGYKSSVLPPLKAGAKARLVIDLSGAFVDVDLPKGFPAFSFAKRAEREFSVLIDAGHGGPDPGAVGGAVLEKQVTLEVAQRVATYLQAAGVAVSLTREDDRAFAFEKRTDLGWRVALAEAKTLFLSVHANAAPERRAGEWRGLEVYYHGPQNTQNLYPLAAAPTSSPTLSELLRSDWLAGLLKEEAKALPADLVETIGLKPPTNLPRPPDPAQREALSRLLAVRVLSHTLGATGAVSRGVRTADFFVIRYTSVPAVLVEVGYLTHPGERQYLQNPDYLERLAYGVARGILEYLDNDAP